MQFDLYGTKQPPTTSMATLATSKSFPPPSLQLALAASVATGAFSDTAYYLYSRRLQYHEVGHPRVVYANSELMKGAGSHFSYQFGWISWSGRKIDSETEDYGYESDSDLDDSEWEERESSSQQPDASGGDTVDERNVGRSRPESTAPSVATSKKLELVGPQYYEHRIFVPNIAANTWQALVHFVYTGSIHFAPLKSQGLDFRRSEQAKHAENNPHLPPLCSPKSVYRLADLFGVEELKKFAQEDLKSRISSENIAREVFCRFSSMHSGILDMHLKVLYTDGVLAEAMPAVRKTIATISQGDMPYSDKALSALLVKLSTFMAVLPEPLPPAPSQAEPVSQLESSPVSDQAEKPTSARLAVSAVHPNTAASTTTVAATPILPPATATTATVITPSTTASASATPTPAIATVAPSRPITAATASATRLPASTTANNTPSTTAIATGTPALATEAALALTHTTTAATRTPASTTTTITIAAATQAAPAHTTAAATTPTPVVTPTTTTVTPSPASTTSAVHHTSTSTTSISTTATPTPTAPTSAVSTAAQSDQAASCPSDQPLANSPRTVKENKPKPSSAGPYAGTDARENYLWRLASVELTSVWARK
ncbi:hypothetical protein BC835DRAFT_668948 [Cytidiella melzeri]|nr:hypothetical protein BC835DRAFT_668948 [Cytidiella melzeri]